MSNLTYSILHTFLKDSPIEMIDRMIHKGEIRKYAHCSFVTLLIYKCFCILYVVRHQWLYAKQTWPYGVQGMK